MRYFSILLVFIFFSACKVRLDKYQDHPKRSKIISLEKAKKLNPSEVKHLIINQYSDTILPNSTIVEFKNLETLIVSGHSAKQNSKDSITLPPLKLNLDHLDKLQNLRILKLSSFDFSTFPTEIFKLKRLRFLELAMSSIDEIPKEIKKLDSLEFLSFRLNNLSQIPNELSKIETLKAIDLANNRFKSFPKVLPEIDSLKYIGLANLEVQKDLPNGVWNWPFPLYINKIDYINSLPTLKELSNKDEILIYIEVRSQDEKNDLLSKFSLEARKKIKFKINKN
tara:strand:- start:3829 stop:4671 length:843 start_codon:yes stop_codon:yes gene_type:complete